MREYLFIGATLSVSYLLSLLHLRLFGFVWYDKLIHFAIGVFFASNYYRLLPKENSVKLASIFAVVYEVFVYLIYGIPFLILPDNRLNVFNLLSNFITKYQEIDEWLDVICAWLGVIICPLIMDNMTELEQKHPISSTL